MDNVTQRIGYVTTDENGMYCRQAKEQQVLLGTPETRRKTWTGSSLQSSESGGPC